MRVAIAGAGAVGRSIARELIQNGHEVLLIDKDSDAIKPERVPDAEWLLADSCELSSLEEARLDKCDVVIAATGDDKANLVTSLLAKTEFGVPRTVGRVNHPNNEWLFTEAWGVDVNVSTPRIMSALVEEAVTVGDLVRLFTFRQGNANLVELTLPADSPYVGKPTGLIPFPDNCALVSILRDGQVYVPDAEQPVESGDELLFVVPEDLEDELEPLLAPTEHGATTNADVTAQADGSATSRMSSALVAVSSRGRRCSGEQPDHGQERRDAERPAEAEPQDGDDEHGRVGVDRAGPAEQPDRALEGHPDRTRGQQHPGQPGAEPHHLLVLVPGQRVARDAAEHEPRRAASRTATRCRTPACSRGCRGSRAGSTRAPGRTRPRRRWPRCG